MLVCNTVEQIGSSQHIYSGPIVTVSLYYCSHGSLLSTIEFAKS